MKKVFSARRVLVLCFVTYSIVYIGRLNFSIASPLLESSGILGKEQIGIFGSIFFIVYAIGRVINGKIGDWFPPKPFLVIGLIFSAFCNIGIAFMPNIITMYILWGLNGFFQSILWGAALRNVSLAYPKGSHAKKATVFLAVSVGVGSILGIVIPTFLANVGLKEIFLIPGFILLGMSLLLLIFLPSHKQIHITEKKASLDFSCLKNKELRSVLFPSIVHGIIKENITLWVPLLFMDKYGMNLKDASFYIFLMPIAILLGRLIFPIWYKICKGNERKTMITSFLATAILLAPFLFCNLPVIISAILLALVSVICSVVNTELCSVYPVNFQATNEVSTVAGILDCAIYIGAALGSAIFGFLLLQTSFEFIFGSWCVLSIIAIIPMLRKKNNRLAKNQNVSLENTKL